MIFRRVWRYQRGNQNPYIEEEQTTQWPKGKGQKDKQRSTKHTHKTIDRVTRSPLKIVVCFVRFFLAWFCFSVSMRLRCLFDFSFVNLICFHWLKYSDVRFVLDQQTVHRKTCRSTRTHYPDSERSIESQFRLVLIIDHDSFNTFHLKPGSLFTFVVSYRYFFRIIVTEDRLYGLSMLHVHRNDTVWEVNSETVLKRWDSSGNRKIHLAFTD